MPFGLSNAPSIVMQVMTQLFRLCINKLLVVYFNDFLGRPRRIVWSIYTTYCKPFAKKGSILTRKGILL